MNTEEAHVSVARDLPLSEPSTRSGVILGALGVFILRYGLVFVLLMWGASKWTALEAAAIQPLVAHSPFLSWIYRIASVQHASELIGCIEIALALLIVVRRWFPRVSAVGSTISIPMFLITVSFLITTPGLDGATQGFLIKDIFLLGAVMVTAGEAWSAAENETR